MKKPGENTVLRYSVYLLMIFFFFFFCVSGCKEEKQRELSQQSASTFYEPEFRKEGELTFITKENKSTIVTIDIEIADTLHEKRIGLMFRKAMADRAGMLFVFGNRKSRFFWMKNTYIPLDMIFIGKGMQIVGIAKNTTPLSEELIPVHEDSQYIVEVNAGFADTYSIQAGDYVVIKSL